MQSIITTNANASYQAIKRSGDVEHTAYVTYGQTEGVRSVVAILFTIVKESANGKRVIATPPLPLPYSSSPHIRA